MGLFGKRKKFRFSEERNLGVFVCSHVADEGKPILHVSHDGDGDWQFLCGGDHSDSEDAQMQCLEHVVEADQTLNKLADLCCNHDAFREHVGGTWHIVDRMEQHIHDNIAEHGWHVMNVWESEEGPGFSYSIGMEKTLGHPEVIVIGLNPDLMMSMINGLGDRIKEGEAIEPGKPIADLLVGFDCVLADVDRRHYRDYVGYARWYYKGDDFRVRQLFWPGKVAGVFPFEDGATEDLMLMQPDLR